MAQRGRKSALAENLRLIAERTGGATPQAAPEPKRLPSPPRDLSPDEAKIWKRITKALGPDWYQPSMEQLLAAYCRASVAARHFARLQEQALAAGDAALYDRLGRARRSEEIVSAKLAHSLCIDKLWKPDPQADEEAAEAAKPKPWEAQG